MAAFALMRQPGHPSDFSEAIPNLDIFPLLLFLSPLDNQDEYALPLDDQEENRRWGKSRAIWCRERWRC
jgi:hypothetical protein